LAVVTLFFCDGVVVCCVIFGGVIGVGVDGDAGIDVYGGSECGCVEGCSVCDSCGGNGATTT